MIGRESLDCQPGRAMQKSHRMRQQSGATGTHHVATPEASPWRPRGILEPCGRR